MKPHQPEASAQQANPVEAILFLEGLLDQQAQSNACDWLAQQRKKVKENERTFFLAFSLASRYFETRPINLSQEQGTAAEQIRPGFRPQYWSQLQIARALLLLENSHQEEERFINTLTRLAETADVAEQTALYAALPLLPHPAGLRKRAAEGIRTNISVVFDAIALHNPYPAEYLEEGPWNQMVLKAVFMNRPLYQIWGADKRTNPALSQMLLDFAHERWAAHRSVTPELWRFVGPHLQERGFSDIERLSREGIVLEREAALLACSTSTLPEAKQFLKKHREIAQRISAGQLSWNSLGQQYNCQ